MTRRQVTPPSMITQVLLGVLGVAMAAIVAWMWQIDKDRHQQTAIATQMEGVIADLTGVVAELNQVRLNTQSIDSLTRITEQLAEWQQEWPRTGLLRADVKQNSDIEFLKVRFGEITERLARLERQVNSGPNR